MASFLRRNEDLRRLRARQMVLQYETGFYPTQDAVLRFVDALGNIGESGVLVDESGNLIVTGSADVSGDLSVGGSTDVSGNLTVDGSGGFGGNLYVGGDLTVDGSLDLSGDLYVYGLVSASGDVISNSGLSRLSTNNTNSQIGTCEAYSFTLDGVGPQIQLFKSSGPAGAVEYDDELGRVNFFGQDASGAFENPAAVSIRAYAAGDFTPTSHPAELRLATCPSGGIAALNRVIISESGNVGIGTPTPQETLDVSGTARVYDGSMNLTIQNNGMRLENTGNANTEIFLSNTGGTTPATLRFLSFGTDGRNYIQSGATDVSDSSAPLLITNMLGVSTSMLVDTSNQRVTIGGDFTPSATLSVAGTFQVDQFTPSSSGASGSTGQICWDDTYIYVKTSTQWKRVALDATAF